MPKAEQTQRLCLFCDRPAGSREHILPRWMGRAYIGDPPPGITVDLVHETIHPDGEQRSTKTAKQMAFYTRAFCRERCNNGWMSRLEDAVKPLLRPMLFSRSHQTLSVDDQERLAFWATKTALAFQTQEAPASTWARPEDFTNLYETQGPLPYAQVWIGARQTWHAAWYRSHSLQRSDSEPDAVDGFGVMLSVGFAVFWVLIPFTLDLRVRLVGDSALAMKRLRPATGKPIAWPPPHLVGGTDLTYLPAALLSPGRWRAG